MELEQLNQRIVEKVQENDDPTKKGINLIKYLREVNLADLVEPVQNLLRDVWEIFKSDAYFSIKRLKER